MKKFHFSLEKVLDLNVQILGVLKSELSAIQARMDEIDRQLEQLDEQFKRKNEELKAELESGITAQRMTQYKLYFTRITAQSNRLTADRIRCEKELEVKKAELIEQKSKISGLEKLKDKQRQEYQALLNKTEERSLEEFVSRALLPV